MAEALLKGRYYSQLRKLGAIGLVATGVTGVAVYFGVYAKRNKLYANYQSALTKEKLNEIDRRVQKYAGVKYDSRFPKLPMIEMKSDEAKESFENLQSELLPTFIFWKLACHELRDIEPDIIDLVTKVNVGLFRVNKNSSAEKKKKFERAKERLKDAIRKYYHENIDGFKPYIGVKEEDLPNDAGIVFMHQLYEGNLLKKFSKKDIEEEDE